ncbi:polysulfide reductase [Shewanella sp. Actino-trap-3]|uniref:NrfD/PsrC family molybdoenzyme membrane anchor subunit n=1 Tax=unclassified Shewanella TaxID=196818 RepID=UPI000C32BCDB|nr:NrfD/PsrC family molybdoenzyme membrane anchor subunit [Shewanella sp. Actino-trap-3]PKG79837.1 polysulfide reductase [Shewanella sp. Actino-trap-3]
MNEVHWGLLVAAYLFLAGAGAGALFISGCLVLSNKIQVPHHLDTAKISAIVGTLLLIIGTGMIVFDLTSFQYGIAHADMSKFFRFYRLFMTFEPSSMMSIGTWLLTLAIIFASLFCLSFRSNANQPSYSRLLATINVILAICVASYTALLIGDISHNLVWSNSILVVIFSLSALSCGAAVVLMVKTRLKITDINHSFAKSDAALLALELLTVCVFAYSIRNISIFNGIDNLLSISSDAGAIWWIGAVLIGLIIPLLLNVTSIIGKTAASHSKEYLLAVLILIGAFCLRYSVLLAGQYY